MTDVISQLAAEAEVWLAQQPAAEPQSDRWYAYGNFRSFIQAIELDPSAIGIAKAVHALNHHIADQFDWSADYCKRISEFSYRADRVGRDLAWNGTVSE